MMRATQEEALVAIVDRFVAVPFVVGGSSLLALLGGNVEVGDIDLVVGSDRLDLVQALAGDWWAGIVTPDDHPHVHSQWLAALDVGGEPIEIMGGLALVVDGVRWELPPRSSGMIELRGRSVPLAPIGPWVALYSVYQPSRALELAAFLSPQEQQRTARELPPGFGIDWPPGNVVA